MYDVSFKIFVIGDEFPGKTLFAQRFLSPLNEPEQQKLIMGVSFYTKDLVVEGYEIKLQVFVLAEEGRFEFLRSQYVRGAQGGLFLFDAKDSSTLAHIDDWLSAIREGIKAEVPIFVVGIAPEENDERQVTAEDGINLVKSRNLNGFIEWNLKTSENVEKIFEALTRLILAKCK